MQSPMCLKVASFCAIGAFGCSSSGSPAGQPADAGRDDVQAPVDAQPAPDASEAAAADAGLCDPVVGACADPSNPKCAIVPSGPGSVLACVPATGTNGNGSSCVRDPGSSAADYGRDNCAPGLSCASLGVLQPTPPDITQFRCRRYCSATKGCGTAEACRTFATAPVYGYCVPTCALFSADCGAGADCSDVSSGDAVSYTVSCRSVGVAKLGDPCTTNLDCAAALGCVASACAALCDATHGCATGTCAPFNGLPKGGGFCK